MDYWVRVLKRRLRYLMVKSGVRQRDIADICDVSDAAVTRWLDQNDPKYPGMGRLYALCDEFNVTPNWLLGYDQDEDFDKWVRGQNEP